MPRNGIKWKPWISFIVIVLSIVGLYLEEKKGHISLGSNAYPSPFFMIICTTTGLLLLFALSDLIRRVSRLDKVISYIGRHTMFILFLHFTAFKIVNLIQVWLYKKEWYEFSAFPHLMTEHGWWIAYTIVGIFIPLIINLLWDQVKLLVIKIDKKTSQEIGISEIKIEPLETMFNIEEQEFLMNYRHMENEKREVITKVARFFVEKK